MTERRSSSLPNFCQGRAGRFSCRYDLFLDRDDLALLDAVGHGGEALGLPVDPGEDLLGPADELAVEPHVGDGRLAGELLLQVSQEAVERRLE